MVMFSHRLQFVNSFLFISCNSIISLEKINDNCSTFCIYAFDHIGNCIDSKQINLFNALPTESKRKSSYKTLSERCQFMHAAQKKTEYSHVWIHLFTYSCLYESSKILDVFSLCWVFNLRRNDVEWCWKVCSPFLAFLRKISYIIQEQSHYMYTICKAMQFETWANIRYIRTYISYIRTAMALSFLFTPINRRSFYPTS